MSFQLKHIDWTEACRQLYRYSTIGVLTNLSGYAVYLILTSHGLSPKATIAAVYFLAAVIGFFANRRFTFRHDGQMITSGIRYVITQLLGYLLNLSMLVLFVDWLDYTHQFVQAGAIVVVAAFLFIMSRSFVFTRAKGRPGEKQA